MSEKTVNIPIPNSYWVIPSEFLAGEYPGSRDPQETIKRIQRFLDLDIDTFIDLTQVDEVPLYSLLLKKISMERDIQLIHHRRPIPDFSIPTVKSMRQTLNFLDGYLDSGKKIYLHCLGGIGRTGTVVGCYLVRHGRSPQEALDWISYLRRDTPDWWHTSPESPAQKQMILNWKIAQ